MVSALVCRLLILEGKVIQKGESCYEHTTIEPLPLSNSSTGRSLCRVCCTVGSSKRKTGDSFNSIIWHHRQWPLRPSRECVRTLACRKGSVQSWRVSAKRQGKQERQAFLSRLQQLHEPVPFYAGSSPGEILLFQWSTIQQRQA